MMPDNELTSNISIQNVVVSPIEFFHNNPSQDLCIVK